MAAYYIESDGAGGTTGGDGSAGAPYGTMAEMIADIGSLSPGDIVALDTDTNGPLFESWSTSNMAGVACIPWPGRCTQVRIYNAIPVDVSVTHDIGGGDPFDTYKTAGDIGFSPVAVVEDWDTRINADGNHYGFNEAGTTIGGLRTNKQWYRLVGSGQLCVSVEDGDTGGAHTYYACKSGDVWTINGCTNCTFTNITWGLATQSGNGNGYGLRITGACSNVTFNSCQWDGCQYHSMGSVGTGTDGLALNSCIFRTASAGNDSHFVAYSTTNKLDSITLSNCDFHLVPWLDWQGNPIQTTGGVKGFASHHLSGAAATPAGGIVLSNCRSYYNGDNPTNAHMMFALSAADTNHSAPTDEDDPDTYPIICRDCSFEGHGINLGGGNNASAHIAFDRCSFDIAAASVASGLGTSGHISATCGTSSSATVMLRACTVSATLNDVASRSIFCVFNNGARMILENTTDLLIGAYANSVCMINTSATAGMLRMKGNIFASDGDNPNLIRGQLNLATALDADGNWYSTSLSSTMSAFNSVSRATWESTWDTNGKYDTAPTFTSNTTLEPAPASIVKNAAKPIGPTGINLLPYNRAFGAWQYGSAVQTHGRGRGTVGRARARRGQRRSGSPIRQ
jgi:hypothetical protein